MFRLVLERNFLLFMLLAAFVLFVGVFVFAVQLDAWNRPPAPDVRVQEFANSGRVVLDENGRMKSQSIDYSAQILSEREVGGMLSNIVAESMTFNADNYAGVTKGVQRYFTPSGYAQYLQFLDNSAFYKTLQEQGLRAGAYAESEPEQLTAGVYDGVYKWVFEVPVMLTFMQRNADTYRDGEITPINRRFVLRAQFARVKEAGNPNAVKVEIWQVLPARSYR